jgi:hypothetical protein
MQRRCTGGHSMMLMTQGSCVVPVAAAVLLLIIWSGMLSAAVWHSCCYGQSLKHHSCCVAD